MTGNPFDLNDRASYERWRDQKLATAPAAVGELVVEVRDPRALSAAEHGALMERIRRCNMVVYAGRVHDEDADIPRRLGAQFGLHRLDANWLAGEDGISEIRVFDDGTRKHYIPYTDRPIKWHTDGYYNTPEWQIRGMVLHCVRPAATGGENRLMDHEMAYLLLRDEDPGHVRALMQPDAMLIPERVDETRRRAPGAGRPGLLARPGRPPAHALHRTDPQHRLEAGCRHAGRRRRAGRAARLGFAVHPAGAT